MTTHSLEQFTLGMYRSALEEFGEQVDAGYPRLRQIRSTHVHRLLRFAQGLEHAHQHTLARGLVKRFNEHALSLANHVYTPEEAALVSDLLNFDFILPPAKKGWSRKNMRTLLDRVIPEIYGPVKYHWFRGECDFTFELKGCKIRTFLDTHSYASKLSYFHDVRLTPDVGFGPTSYLRWLGITGSETSWDAADDELQAIHDFVKVSGRFRQVLEMALLGS